MRIAAIVLAAGFSTRFGAADKLTAVLNGWPLIRWTAAALFGSQFDDIVVVTGPDATLIEPALEGLGRLRVIVNTDPGRAMGSSIATGVTALDPATTGVAIVPGDMPCLSAAVFDPLIEAFRREGARHIVYPTRPDGARRPPVLWPSSFFPLLRALDGPLGARTLLQENLASAIAVRITTSWRLADVDTTAALAQVSVRLAGRRPGSL